MMWSPCLLHQSLWDPINYFYFIVRQNRKEPSPLPIAPHPSCQLKNLTFLGCFHKRRAKPYAVWGVHLQELRSRMWPKEGTWLMWLPKPGQASFHQDVPQRWPFTNNTKNHSPRQRFNMNSPSCHLFSWHSLSRNPPPPTSSGRASPRTHSPVLCASSLAWEHKPL